MNSSLFGHVPKHQVLCLLPVAQENPPSPRKRIHASVQFKGQECDHSHSLICPQYYINMTTRIIMNHLLNLASHLEILEKTLHHPLRSIAVFWDCGLQATFWRIAEGQYTEGPTSQHLRGTSLRVEISQTSSRFPVAARNVPSATQRTASRVWLKCLLYPHMCKMCKDSPATKRKQLQAM